jgi:hypothetical protein
MGHFDPDRIDDGRRSIASEYYPLIGPYDSGDPQVLEYHLLLMKLAGIDGVIVDWYGLESFRDYAVLHANTQRLVEQVQRLGMKFAICYEDQTIPALVADQRLAASERVSHAAGEIEWLADHWFKLDGYVRLEGRPVLLSFGHAGLDDGEWTQCLQRLGDPVAYFSEHERRTAAMGGFDWPVPQQGLSHTTAFLKRSGSWPQAIPVAFPRFVDIYAKARVSEGYGVIPDERGKTLQSTLSQALASNARLIQIATWNDWGEGTQIEPSLEFGYRDLELVQRLRRSHIDAKFVPTATDLRLPYRLLEQRRAASTEADTKRLDAVAELLAAGKIIPARAALRGGAQ